MEGIVFHNDFSERSYPNEKSHFHYWRSRRHRSLFQAIQAGNTVYFSGQLGIDPATGKLAEGVEAQTVQSLKNVQALLQEVGATAENVVKTTVYITSMDDFPVVNAAYAKVFDRILRPVPAWP